MFHILSGWMQQPTPNHLLTLPSYRGFPPVHQNGGGTGMAFAENAPRVLKKEQLGGLGRHRRHRVNANAPRHKKHTTPKLSSDGKCINLNSCFFFSDFFQCVPAQGWASIDQKFKRGRGCPNTNKEDGVIFKTSEYFVWWQVDSGGVRVRQSSCGWFCFRRQQKKSKIQTIWKKKMRSHNAGRVVSKQGLCVLE